MDVWSAKGMLVLVVVFCAGMGCWHVGSSILAQRQQQREELLYEKQQRAYERELVKIDQIEQDAKKRQALLELRGRLLVKSPELAAQVDTKLLEMMLLQINRSDEAAKTLARKAALSRMDTQAVAVKTERQMKVAQDLMAAAEEKKQTLKALKDSLILREKEVAVREKQLAAAQEQLSSLAMDLSLVKERLEARSAEIDTRMSSLEQKEKELDKAIAKAGKSRSLSDQVIILSQPAAPSVSSSFIIRETVPVYVGNWWGGYPFRPRRHYRPRPTPFPRNSGVRVNVGGSGVRVRISK